MKRMVLLRHGHAETYFEDWERQLSSRGKGEVLITSKKILEHKNFLPQILICSEARRAKETYEIFTKVYASEFYKTIFVPSLYYGPVSEVLKEFSHLPETCKNLMVIGHNPILSELASTFSSKDVYLSTAQAALLSSKEEDKEWEFAISDTWNLEASI